MLFLCMDMIFVFDVAGTKGFFLFACVGVVIGFESGWCKFVPKMRRIGLIW